MTEWRTIETKTKKKKKTKRRAKKLKHKYDVSLLALTFPTSFSFVFFSYSFRLAVFHYRHYCCYYALLLCIGYYIDLSNFVRICYSQVRASVTRFQTEILIELNASNILSSLTNTATGNETLRNWESSTNFLLLVCVHVFKCVCVLIHELSLIRNEPKTESFSIWWRSAWLWQNSITDFFIIISNAMHSISFLSVSSSAVVVVVLASSSSLSLV